MTILKKSSPNSCNIDREGDMMFDVNICGEIQSFVLLVHPLPCKKFVSNRLSTFLVFSNFLWLSAKTRIRR